MMVGEKRIIYLNYTVGWRQVERRDMLKDDRRKDRRNIFRRKMQQGCCKLTVGK
jgi:hypothetical protein